MENLFYDCDIDNKFDLKGSKRNRLVDPNNQNGEETVLLDENLIQSKVLCQLSSNSFHTFAPSLILKYHFQRYFLSMQCLGRIRGIY